MAGSSLSQVLGPWQNANLQVTTNAERRFRNRYKCNRERSVPIKRSQACPTPAGDERRGRIGFARSISSAAYASGYGRKLRS